MSDDDLDRRFAEHARRFTDKFKEHKKDVDQEFKSISDSVTMMQTDIREMREILEAWNNLKGFASGMRILSAAVKILTPIILLIGGIVYFIKTGQMPKE